MPDKRKVAFRIGHLFICNECQRTLSGLWSLVSVSVKPFRLYTNLNLSGIGYFPTMRLAMALCFARWDCKSRVRS